MTNDAIINNTKVELSADEVKRAASFHKSRYAFAWVNGKLVFNDNENDDRDHQHWLCEDYGITVEEWENTPRGYMMAGKIQLFIGSQFKPLDTNKISVIDFETLLHTQKNKFGTDKVVVYNGVKVGKVGDIWEPLEKMGEFDLY